MKLVLEWAYSVGLAMKPLFDWFSSLPITKLLVIGSFAVIGAALPKDLSPRDRLMTFFVGFLAALVFGEPAREVLGLPNSAAYGMAGVLAMTGKNLAVFALRATRDPAGTAKVFWEIWRGTPK